MAIRYSGDVETRLSYGGAGRIRRDRGGEALYFDPNGQGYYYAAIRAPGVRRRAILSQQEVGVRRNEDPQSSESYDDAALAFFEWAEEHLGELPLEYDLRNRIVVHRTFQAPCPVRRAR